MEEFFLDDYKINGLVYIFIKHENKARHIAFFFFLLSASLLECQALTSALFPTHEW